MTSDKRPEGARVTMLEAAFHLDENGVQMREDIRRAGLNIEMCLCGRLMAMLAFEAEADGIWFVLAVHLPAEVDLAHAARNIDAVTGDALLYGRSADEEIARAAFPVLSARVAFAQVEIQLAGPAAAMAYDDAACGASGDADDGEFLHA